MEENQLNVRPIKGGFYDKRYVAQLVAEVVGGKSIRQVCEEYGVNRSTLRDWVYYQDLRLEEKRKKKPVAPALKRSIVRSILSGRITIKEAHMAQRVRPDTIRKWIKEIQQENVELVDQTDEIMAKEKSGKKNSSSDQQADVKALQKALQEAQLKIAALNTLIDVAEEQLKINIRKKPGAKQSND